MIYLTHINLNQNELQNAVIQPLATPPANPKLGQIYTDANDGRIKSYNGNTWKTVGLVVESSATNGSISIDGVDMEVYKLPIASETELGGIIPGKGFKLSADGTLHIAGLEEALATDDYVGKTPRINSEGKVEWIKPDTTTVEGLSTTVEGLKSDVQALDAKVDSIKVPTKLTELTNDANFIDNTVNNLTNYYLKTETYTKDEVHDLLGQISTIDTLVVTELPTEDISTTTIYLVAKTSSGTNDIYDEYIYVQSTSKWELIGNTSLDLSNYLQKNGDASNVTVAFTSAEEKSLPTSGEAMNIILGKIIKYLTDLHEVAFSGSYSDLKDTPDTSKVEMIEIVLPAGATSAASGSITGKLVNWFAYDVNTREHLLCDVVEYTDTTEDGINTFTLEVSVNSAHTNDIKIAMSVIQ